MIVRSTTVYEVIKYSNLLKSKTSNFPVWGLQQDSQKRMAALNAAILFLFEPA